MAISAVSLKGRDWYKEERVPGKPQDQIRVVNPDASKALEGCPRFLTVKQVAELLSFSAQGIYEFIRTKRLKAHSIGNRKRIYREDLAEFLMIETLKAQ